MICLQPKSRMADNIAVLLLSVPPLVKKISPGWAFNNLATDFLAVSIASFDSLPYE